MGSENRESGGGTLPRIQLAAKLELPLGELGNPACGQFGNDVIPLGNSARCDAECPSCDAWLTTLGVEVMKDVFFEHAPDYSMLKSDFKYAIEGPAYSAPMQTMGERIRLLRQARGWSQTELAEKVGVTGGAISQWELGGTKNIKLETFLRLCSELGTQPHYLIFGPEQRSPKAGSRQA